MKKKKLQKWIEVEDIIRRYNMGKKKLIMTQ